MRLNRGEQLDLRIDSLAYGGNGVARNDGMVVFVAGALPGDRVVAEVTRSKRDYAEARTLEVMTAGSDRVEPACLHAGEPCPGAPWQVLAYEAQLHWKATQLQDALQRIGRFETVELEPIVSAEEVWRYRNKLEYSFAQTDEGELVLGFHRRGRWWEVVDVEDCLLASEQNNAIRDFVRRWCRQRGLSAYDRRTKTGFLRNLVIREGRRTAQVQVELITGEPSAEAHGFDQADFQAALAERFAQIKSLVWTVSSDEAEVAQGVSQLLAGSEWIEEELAGLRFKVSPRAFFQTNTEMAERLFQVAAELAVLGGTERVFDLYCGIGAVGLMLSTRAREVHGIDVEEEAVRDAIHNAELNELTNVSFYAGNARTAVRPLVEQAGKPDVVVLDPPRAGLSQKVVRRVLETGAKRIVYISCNPTTMAPNLRQMADAGYRLQKVRPVDMFPQTPHIESVALLTI